MTIKRKLMRKQLVKSSLKRKLPLRHRVKASVIEEFKLLLANPQDKSKQAWVEDVPSSYIATSKEIEPFLKQFGIDYDEIEDISYDEITLSILDVDTNGAFDEEALKEELVGDMTIEDIESYFSAFTDCGHIDIAAALYNEVQGQHDFKEALEDAYKYEVMSSKGPINLAQDYIDSIGSISELGERTLRTYFDYEAFGNDLATDYYETSIGYLREI